MEALPLERAPSATVATVMPPAESMAPSQQAYARPGLPGERAAAPRPAVEAEPEVQLTPEQEVLAAFVDDDEPEAVAPVEEAPVRREREAVGGLRFAEEIGELQVEEEDMDARRGAAPRRGARGRPGPAARVRPTAPKGPRRFEVDEDEIEAALRGDDFLDDDDDDEGDDEDEY